MKINFNENWKFRRCDEEKAWEEVRLPHAVRIETLVTGPSGTDDPNAQWQGKCIYKKSFSAREEYKNKKLFIHFEAA